MWMDKGVEGNGRSAFLARPNELIEEHELELSGIHRRSGEYLVSIEECKNGF
jgi:hypothetical protein